MANDPHETREHEKQSLFPAREGPSFCSRPTPVVPANPDLCAADHDAERAPGRASMPSVRPSDRPTYVPADYVEPRLESPPTLTIGEPTPIDGALEETAPAATSGVPGAAAPPPLPAAAPAPSLPPIRVRRGRVHFARFLFVVLFGGVGALLSYAFKPQLAGAIEQLRGPAAHEAK
jgi:hypothetical protein